MTYDIRSEVLPGDAHAPTHDQVSAHVLAFKTHLPQALLFLLIGNKRSKR